MSMSPYAVAWEPDSALYGPHMPGSLRNVGHVNDPQLTAMLKEQRRTQDLAARKQLIFAIQRYVAEQQYYIYLYCYMLTGSHQPYVKNYGPNWIEDYGNVAAALWLDRERGRESLEKLERMPLPPIAPPAAGHIPAPLLP